jgi:hypothetical protein
MSHAYSPIAVEPPFQVLFEALKAAAAPTGFAAAPGRIGVAEDLLLDRLLLAHREGCMPVFAEALVIASEHVIDYYDRLLVATRGGQA